MRELHWHRSWAEEPGYTAGNPPEDYGHIRGGCSFPSDDCCRLVLQYTMPHSLQLAEHILMTRGEKYYYYYQSSQYPMKNINYAQTRDPIDAALMLDYRMRRCPNVNLALGQPHVVVKSFPVCNGGGPPSRNKMLNQCWFNVGPVS